MPALAVDPVGGVGLFGGVGLVGAVDPVGAVELFGGVGLFGDDVNVCTFCVFSDSGGGVDSACCV